VRRVSVVGTSGVGKSTVASSLARLLGADFLELDSLQHQADWTPLPTPEFRVRVAAVAEGERWVIDGNYSRVQDIVWARADTVVWLDLPRRTVMRRVIWRTLRRVGGRVELWNGNRERWRNFFALDKEESVIVWARRTGLGTRRRWLTR
jgi:adenylate kinase family enzyme